MNLIKRILLCIAVLISISAFSIIAASAEGEPKYYLLRTENFSLPDSGLWSLQSDASKYTPSLPGNYLKSSKGGPAAEASVYITEPGDYIVWAMVLDFDNVDFGKRHALIEVDGVLDDNKFGSTVKDGFTWSKTSKAYNLDAGLHTIGVKVGYPSTCVSAVFVTNDLNFTLDENTVYEDIFKYADTSKPTFAEEIEISRDTYSSFTVTFPEASDNVSVAGYQYFVNGKEVQVDGNAYLADGLLPLQSYKVKVVAFDGLGNTISLEKDVDMFDWKLNELLVTDENEVPIESLESLEEGQTEIDVTLKVTKLLSGLKRPYVFAGIYTCDEKRMVEYKMPRWNATGTEGAEVSKTVTLTLPQEVIDNPQNYIIKATIFEDDADIMPHVTGLTFGGR